MVIVQHIQNGITLASDSFLAIWEHKKLLVYLLIPVLLNLIFGIQSAYDFVYALISRGAPTSLFPALNAMGKAIIADLGIACLSVHTCALLENETASIRKTVATIAHRIPIIAAWSLIAGAIIYGALSGLELLSAPFENMGWILHLKSINRDINPATILQLFLGFLWLISVFFMIQILALEELSILDSFKLSLQLARNLMLEIIGGEFWIGLIWFLSVLPFMILFDKPMAYHLLNNKMIHDDWSWITLYALIIIGWVCASAQSVFRTKLYYRYYVEPIEDEIDVMFYPRF